MENKMAEVISLISTDPEMSCAKCSMLSAKAILASEHPSKIKTCPDKGSLMVCMDCENKHKTSKCTRPATIGEVLNER